MGAPPGVAAPLAGEPPRRRRVPRWLPWVAVLVVAAVVIGALAYEARPTPSHPIDTVTEVTVTDTEGSLAGHSASNATYSVAEGGQVVVPVAITNSASGPTYDTTCIDSGSSQTVGVTLSEISPPNLCVYDGSTTTIYLALTPTAAGFSGPVSVELVDTSGGSSL